MRVVVLGIDLDGLLVATQRLLILAQTLALKASSNVVRAGCSVRGLELDQRLLGRLGVPVTAASTGYRVERLRQIGRLPVELLRRLPGLDRTTLLRERLGEVVGAPLRSLVGGKSLDRTGEVAEQVTGVALDHADDGLGAEGRGDLGVPVVHE